MNAALLILPIALWIVGTIVLTARGVVALDYDRQEAARLFLAAMFLPIVAPAAALWGIWWLFRTAFERES